MRRIAKGELYSTSWRHHGSDRHSFATSSCRLRASCGTELATYELDQIKESFQDAATLDPGIPVTDMTIVVEPVRLLGEATLPLSLN